MTSISSFSVPQENMVRRSQRLSERLTTPIPSEGPAFDYGQTARRTTRARRAQPTNAADPAMAPVGPLQNFAYGSTDRALPADVGRTGHVTQLSTIIAQSVATATTAHTHAEISTVHEEVESGTYGALPGVIPTTENVKDRSQSPVYGRSREQSIRQSSIPHQFDPQHSARQQSFSYSEYSDQDAADQLVREESRYRSVSAEAGAYEDKARYTPPFEQFDHVLDTGRVDRRPIRSLKQMITYVALGIALFIVGHLASEFWSGRGGTGFWGRMPSSKSPLSSDNVSNSTFHSYVTGTESRMATIEKYLEELKQHGEYYDNLFSRATNEILETRNEVMQTRNDLLQAKDGLGSVESTVHLNGESIKRLNEILPDLIVVRAGDDGRPTIDPMFWEALKAKLEVESAASRGGKDEELEALAREMADLKAQWREVVDLKGSTAKEAEILARNMAELKAQWQESATLRGRTAEESAVLARNMAELNAQWQEFLSLNERRVQEFLRESLIEARKGEFERAVEDDYILPKKEYINMLDTAYNSITTNVDERLRYVEDSLRRSVDRRIDDAISDHYLKMAKFEKTWNLPESQLEAIAHVAMMANKIDALGNVNFISEGQGARIDPFGTTKALKGHARGDPVFGERPETVINPWLDVGNCWCTLATGAPQISIDTARIVFPREVVVEHAPAQATLDIEAAPKNIEMWGKLTTLEALEPALHAAKQEFNHDPSPESVKGGWVLMAQFKYDINFVNHIQYFSVGFDTERYNASVDKVTFRIRDNWGHPQRTCLYRLRLHGKVAQAETKIDIEPTFSLWTWVRDALLGSPDPTIIF